MVKSIFGLITIFSFVYGDLIKYLPGIGKLGTKHHHGYLNAVNHRQIHYWLVESQDNPSKDPVILWLSGGPGCSGLLALFTEIGPYLVDPNGPALVVNSYSWNKIANLLIFESPAGIGFAANMSELSPGDYGVMEDNLAALLHFFNKFPEYQENDFYVAGESYAGIYVPMLASKILDTHEKYRINLKGIAIGNGILNTRQLVNSFVPFAYYRGLIDQRFWTVIKRECCSGDTDECDFEQSNEFCWRVAKRIQSARHLSMNWRDMFAECSEHSSRRVKRFAQVDSLTCRGARATETYLNRAEVREALSFPPEIPEWKLCSSKYAMVQQVIHSVQLQMEKILNLNAKVLLFYGDLDLVAHFVSGEIFAAELGYDLSERKHAFTLDNLHAGFRTRYGNLEVVIIQGAGHMVSADKPKAALYVMENFLHRPDYKTMRSVANETDLSSLLDVSVVEEKPLYLLAPVPGVKSAASGYRSRVSSKVLLFHDDILASKLLLLSLLLFASTNKL